MRKSTLIVAVALLITTSFTGAQTQTGTITGAIRDSQGAVLPGVSVTIASPALIGTRTNVTATNGVYRFANVPTGVYSLTFELAGFQRLSRQGIRVPVATTITVDITLQISGVEETVTVTGSRRWST